MTALSFGGGCLQQNDSAVIDLAQGEIMYFGGNFGSLIDVTTAEPNEPHSAPTLSAVARLAGVSAITVSRVVRLPNLVAPETRGRVETAMRELGYVPNQLAGALASARTRSVGVLVPTIANSIFADTVQGLSDELEPLGYAVILAQSRYDAAREDHMLAAFRSRRHGIFRRRRSTPSPASTITRPGLRSRGIWLRKAAGSWRSSAATIPGPHAAGMDSRTRRLSLVRRFRAD